MSAQHTPGPWTRAQLQALSVGARFAEGQRSYARALAERAGANSHAMWLYLLLAERAAIAKATGSA